VNKTFTFLGIGAAALAFAATASVGIAHAVTQNGAGQVSGYVSPGTIQVSVTGALAGAQSGHLDVNSFPLILNKTTETSYIAEVTTTTVGGKVTKVTKTPGVVTSGDIAVISADLSTKGDTEVTVLFTSTKLLGIDHASAGSDQIGLPRTKTFKENLTVDMKPGQTKILSLDDFGMNHGTITLNMVGA
jgi:hypothetical protein